LRTSNGASRYIPEDNANTIYSNDIDIYSAISSKLARPFIQVTILGTIFPALLDTGSSVLIIGDDVIEVVHKAGVKCRKLTKEIRFLKGACQATNSVSWGLVKEANYNTSPRCT